MFGELLRDLIAVAIVQIRGEHVHGIVHDDDPFAIVERATGDAELRAEHSAQAFNALAGIRGDWRDFRLYKSQTIALTSTQPRFRASLYWPQKFFICRNYIK